MWASILVVVFVLAFAVYCLNDLAHADTVLRCPPVMWAALICFTGPFGGLVHLTYGKPR
jgi:hypothetical protein